MRPKAEQDKGETMRVCKVCIMRYGLNGNDIINKTCPFAFEDDDEQGFIQHLKTEHGVTVMDK
jgi:hypothetical protein